MTAKSQSKSTSPVSTSKHLLLAERRAAGKALRDKVPRASHGYWKPDSDRLDPIILLEESSQGRLPELVPIRYGRMLESPFAFLRGAAIVMAADLATTAATGIKVQVCGDCHLVNFGGYGTPERNLVFDVNDFDETLPAPWEWDVKRLATSIIVAGRQIKTSAKNCEEAALTAACSYREHLDEYAQMSPLDVWYSHIDAKFLLDFARSRKEQQDIERILKKAEKSTSAEVFPRLTEEVNGQRRIKDHPPLVFHAPSDDPLEAEMLSVFHQYRETLRDDLRVLLDRYHLVDIAMKVVGVGSVGTRCAVALLIAEDDNPLFLQIKQANAPVLEPYAGKSNYQNQGQRVVVGQHLMQAASDLFLGWTCSKSGHDFYLRQLRDMKTSIDIEDMSASDLIGYSKLCGWALARAHARSGDPVMISGYLGKSDMFEQAIAAFAVAYADQTECDYEALVAAVKTGRLEATKEKRQ